MKENETMCLVCNGAGLVRSDRSSMKVELCPSCNGHGVLAVDPVKQEKVAFNATFRIDGG